MLSRFNRTNLAFTGGSAAMHCLTELSDLAHMHQATAVPVAHTHADGAKHKHTHEAPMQMVRHKHGDGGTHDHGKPGKADDGNCCGLLCLSALNHDGVAALPSPPPAARTKAAPEPERASHDPGRIDEPPIG
jgi:hypothetical protein